MKYIRIALLPSLLVIVLAVLFGTTTGANAAPNTSTEQCGAWNAVSSSSFPEYGRISSIAAVSTNDAWMVGFSSDENGGNQSAVINHWNGSTWQRVATPMVAGASSVVLSSVTVISSNNAWAVGYSEDADVNAFGLIEHWNGSTWQIIPGPKLEKQNILKAVSAVSSNDIWAVGAFTLGGGDQQGLAEHWNGSTWQTVDVPSSVVGLNDITAFSNNNDWAVGSSTTNVIHWDGTHWSDALAPPEVTADGSQSLFGITAVSSNDIWAVGDISLNTGNHRGITEHWDGTSWTSVNTPDVNLGATFNAVSAVATNDVWAVGESYITYTNSSGNVKRSILPLIEHWDGTSWSVIDSPASVATTRASSFVAIAPVPETHQLWASGSSPKNTFYAPFVAFSNGC